MGSNRYFGVLALFRRQTALGWGGILLAKICRKCKSPPVQPARTNVSKTEILLHWTLFYSMAIAYSASPQYPLSSGLNYSKVAFLMELKWHRALLVLALATECFLKHENLQQTNGKSPPKWGLSPVPSISQRMATKPGGTSDSSQHIFNFVHLTNPFSECYSSNEHLGENLDLHRIVLWTRAEPESAGGIAGNS